MRSFCRAFFISMLAICGPAALGETDDYVFVAASSTIIQTGGIAGVHWTYATAGRFHLTVDRDRGIAWFAHVDANAVDGSPYRRTLDPNEVFGMTHLVGTVLADASIRFTGTAGDGSSVVILLKFEGNRVYLAGETTAPAGSADFFVFALEASAERRYSGGVGTGKNPYQIATAADLIALGSRPEDHGRHLVLTADIDLKPDLPGRKVFHTAIIAPVTETVTEDYEGPTFSGVFDGRGHKIRNATLSGHENLGIWGHLGRGAMVLNLVVEGVHIVGTGDCIGGIVGYNQWGCILNSYATGSVSGARYVGGLVGYNRDGIISNSHSTVGVTGSQYAGGLGGANERGHISNSFWDVASSGQATSAGGTGLTPAQMRGRQVFVDAGWDFEGESKNGTCEVWTMAVNGAYPTLTVPTGDALEELDGEGTEERPYRLKTIQDLGMMWRRPGACYELASDLDLSEVKWSMAPVPVFGGQLDGRRHRIVNMTLAGAGYLALFGRVTEGAIVSDLYLEDVTVTGAGAFVGGLVGFNGGLVLNCGVSGLVSGSYSTGGLIGSNEPGIISCCRSIGSVRGRGQDNVGGLVGRNSGQITNCYSRASVTGGSEDLGGLVGAEGGTVIHCYSTGSVSGGHQDVGGLVGECEDGMVLGSFWDMLTSGQITGDCGAGRTTEAMQTARTFLDAGWDFVGETVNGSQDVWWIFDGRDYPRLWWERVLGDDFEDGKAGPLWFVYEPEPELARIREVNGRLEARTVGSWENVDAVYVSDGWRLDTTKDFAIRVDFHFSKQGAGDGRITLGVGPSLDPDARRWAELEAGCFDSGPFYLYEVSDGFWVQEVVADRSADEGTLFMSYNSAADELYFSHSGYGKANAWQTVSGLLAGRWSRTPVYVLLGIGSEGMVLTGADAWLDDFAVNVGTLVQGTLDGEDDLDD